MSDTGFDVEFGVPDDLFSISLAREDTDEATEQLRRFVQQRADSDVARAAVLEQLLAARAALQTERLVWSGVMTAPIDGQWVLAVFAVNVRALRGGETTTSLADEIARRYQDDAVLEPFPTQHCEAVGVRRIGTLLAGDDEITTAVAQVLCVFPSLGALATVTGIALSLEDLDTTTLIVGAIADTVQLRAGQAL